MTLADMLKNLNALPKIYFFPGPIAQPAKLWLAVRVGLVAARPHLTHRHREEPGARNLP